MVSVAISHRRGDDLQQAADGQRPTRVRRRPDVPYLRLVQPPGEAVETSPTDIENYLPDPCRASFDAGLRDARPTEVGWSEGYLTAVRPGQARPAQTRPGHTRPARVAGLRSATSRPAPIHLTRRGRALVWVLLLAATITVAALLAPATQAAAPAGPPRAVTVHAGDTMWSIATRALPRLSPDVAIERVRMLNHLPDDEVFVGEQILVPAG